MEGSFQIIFSDHKFILDVKKILKSVPYFKNVEFLTKNRFFGKPSRNLFLPTLDFSIFFQPEKLSRSCLWPIHSNFTQCFHSNIGLGLRPYLNWWRLGLAISLHEIIATSFTSLTSQWKHMIQIKCKKVICSRCYRKTCSYLQIKRQWALYT